MFQLARFAETAENGQQKYASRRTNVAGEKFPFLTYSPILWVSPSLHASMSKWLHCLVWWLGRWGGGLVRGKGQYFPLPSHKLPNHQRLSSDVHQVFSWHKPKETKRVCQDTGKEIAHLPFHPHYWLIIVNEHSSSPCHELGFWGPSGGSPEALQLCMLPDHSLCQMESVFCCGNATLKLGWLIAGVILKL